MLSMPWRKPAASRPSALAGINLGRLLSERARTLAHFAGQAPPITRVVAVPRAIRLGGGRRVVMELRVRDLAALQAWLEDAVPHPLADVPPCWADPDPATRPARLAAIWEAAGSWPPRYGTREGMALLSSTGGRAYFLHLCLRRADPRSGLADALALLGEITPAEWSHLQRVAYGTLPREEIGDELAPDRSPGKPTDWGKVFDQLLEHRGLDYERVADLTLSQFRNVMAAGKPAEKSPEYGSMMARVRRAIAALKGR